MHDNGDNHEASGKEEDMLHRKYQADAYRRDLIDGIKKVGGSFGHFSYSFRAFSPGIMHQLLRYACKLHIGIGFSPKKPSLCP
jgi:hypothetical protein